MQRELIEDIKSLLAPAEELNRKQVALYLPQNKIDLLNEVVESLRPYSNGKVNRNTLIEIAIDDLIDKFQSEEYLNMFKNLLNLFDIKKSMEANQELALHTHNKQTGWIGVASFFTNGEDKIGVYEGNPDGSDDKDMTFEDFINNYDFYLGHEMEDVSERWN